MFNGILKTLLSLFETTSKLDSAYKETFGDILAEYTYTEMHCIDCIGKIKNPNVTKIAQSLNLTKAAISKSIKKLLTKKSIKTYKNPDNKKEIYYELTEIGKEVFEKHLVMHKIWCTKDEEFFRKFNKSDIEITLKVLNEYNKTLESRLKSIMEDLKWKKHLKSKSIVLIAPI